MTTETTPPTRVEYAESTNTVSFVERKSDQAGGYINIGWSVKGGADIAATAVPLGDIPALCAAIDAVSGGAYRQKVIETFVGAMRDLWETAQREGALPSNDGTDLFDMMVFDAMQQPQDGGKRHEQ